MTVRFGMSVCSTVCGAVGSGVGIYFRWRKAEKLRKGLTGLPSQEKVQKGRHRTEGTLTGTEEYG